MVFTRYYDQDITAPAGTLITAPVSVVPQLEDNMLERIEIDVPDGHDRLTGIRIAGQSMVIVPFSLNGWIVANNHYFEIPFNDHVSPGDITIQAYNTDVFPHTFYVRFVMSNLALAVTAAVVSAQIRGTVPANADQAVAAVQVTPDDLAAAQLATPPPVPVLAVPPPDVAGA